jgi:hypothetical protein
MTQRADLVVHGRVLAQTCKHDAAGRIYTEVTLQMIEVWKGSLLQPELSVVHSGGILNGETVAVTGQVAYTNGEEVVAFLVRNAQGQNVTVGLAQGKFEIIAGPVGEKLARNPFYGTRGSPPRGALDKMGAGNPPLTQAELKRRVQGAVR